MSDAMHGETGAPILHLSLPVADLATSRSFYVDLLGCRPGRERPDFVDVWFFGLQLTLHHRPDEVRRADEQGSRHFGVALADRRVFDALLTRLREAVGVAWLTPLTEHPVGTLSGKVEFKIADPSGNVIEFKHYPDPAELLAADG